MLTLEVQSFYIHSLKSILFHMLVKTEQNRMVRIHEILRFLTKKGYLKPFLINRWHHFESFFFILFVCLFLFFVKKLNDAK